METIKNLYRQSILAQAVAYLTDIFMPCLLRLVSQSHIINTVKNVYSVIVNSKIFRLIFDTEYIAGLWYKSRFYRTMTLRIRRLSFSVEKASVKFDIYFIALFLAVILLMPAPLWSDALWISALTALAVLYLSHNIRNRVGTVFALVNLLIIIFIILSELALPYNSVMTIVYLLLGIDFFFLMSFAVRSDEDLEKILLAVFVLSAVLCCMGFLQNSVWGTEAHATLKDGVTFGEILLLLFPFAISYSMEMKAGARKYLYTAFTVIAFINVIIATQSRAGFIGFIIELAIIMITDIKFAPFIVLLMPFGLASVFDNFRAIVTSNTAYGNIINNVVGLFRQLWNLGFGVDRGMFMEIYNSAHNIKEGSRTMISIPYVDISPVYKSFVIDIGAIVMVGFLYYILKLAHSSLTLIFTGEKRYKRFFSAGLATLVGLSVSSFFESNMFEPRTLLLYWGMLGILRAVRIMDMKVYEA